MENVLSFLSDIRVIIAIAVLVVILIVWFVVQKMSSNKYKKELEALEVRYNQIKSVPLSFKLNKANTIAHQDKENNPKIMGYNDDFDKAQANMKQIAQALADTEDDILVGKNKKVKAELEDLSTSLELGEKQVTALDKALDEILVKEREQRSEVNELKDQFRSLKATAQERSNILSYSWTTIEQNITDTEKMFSAFEEWMFASEYEKANAEMTNIKDSMKNLEEIITTLPDLLQDARGVIPNMVEALHHDYTATKDRGVYLSHLNVEKNLALITSSLKEDLAHLKAGDAKDVRSHLDDYKTRLTQMDEAIKRENLSNDELNNFRNETEQLSKDTEETNVYVHDKFEKASVRFGLEDLEQELETITTKVNQLKLAKNSAFELAEKEDVPASTVLVTMKDLNQELTDCNKKLKDMKDRLDRAQSDEERAKNQLLKLQIIMNDMQVKCRKYKLPSISKQYESDLTRGYEYIHSLSGLIEENPLNVQLLNSTLSEAISFIYKLYNDLNNMVASVVMVENTIVFGNRYRSTYADIDSDLTRSELCFRNGEYTQALTIAIATVEKIHPGNYEAMIKENSKSAA